MKDSSNIFWIIATISVKHERRWLQNFDVLLIYFLFSLSWLMLCFNSDVYNYLFRGILITKKAMRISLDKRRDYAIRIVFY